MDYGLSITFVHAWSAIKAYRFLPHHVESDWLSWVGLWFPEVESCAYAYERNGDLFAGAFAVK